MNVVAGPSRDAEECTRALERALAAMKPPLDVYEGILQLIAKFVPFGEFRGLRPEEQTPSLRSALRHGQRPRVFRHLRRWPHSDAEREGQLPFCLSRRATATVKCACCAIIPTALCISRCSRFAPTASATHVVSCAYNNSDSFPQRVLQLTTTRRRRRRLSPLFVGRILRQVPRRKRLSHIRQDTQLSTVRLDFDASTIAFLKNSTDRARRRTVLLRVRSRRRPPRQECCQYCPDRVTLARREITGLL